MVKKVKALVENQKFQNAILIVIAFNALIMGLQTSQTLVASIGTVLDVLDKICLGIFIIEIILKLIAYGWRFFADGWNWFDFIVVGASLVSGLSFLSVLRVFRIFRVFRSLKALKGIRAMRLVSRLDKLRLIIGAIGKSIPGISWTAVLLLLIYYIFGIIGNTLFGEAFPDWFGSLGKSVYTLFQVMTLESWSMGISRPVMEVYSWAWVYFVPFVLISSFVVMNVVVGIVVNSISEVQAQFAAEKAERLVAKADEKAHKNDDKSEDAMAESVEVRGAAAETDKNAAIRAELENLRIQIDRLEKML